MNAIPAGPVQYSKCFLQGLLLAASQAVLRTCGASVIAHNLLQERAIRVMLQIWLPPSFTGLVGLPEG